MKRYAIAGLLGIGLLSYLLQPTPRPLRGQLLDIRDTYSLAATKAQLNMKNQFTPGYKSRVQWGEGSDLNWSQGEIFKTRTDTNLAINGAGCFGLEGEGKIAYTRDGRFTFQEGILKNADGWSLLGMPLDTMGNICGESAPLRLDLDPNTKLYGGRFTGFHFDETGKLYGESTQVDPVTGQQCTTQTPLFQVLLYQFPNPAGLADHPGPSHTIWTATPRSGAPVSGVPGQGALGAICPSSLELANVDFMQEGMTLQWVTSHSRAFAGPLEPSPVQQEMRAQFQRNPQFRQAALDNLSHTLTPGWRSWDLLGYLQTGRLELRHGQASLLETKNPTDLALDGPGYFLLSSGEITRNGRLLWTEKGLAVGDPDHLMIGYVGERLEPVRIPQQAANWEITSLGEVRWTELSGNGQTVTGYRLALAQSDGPVQRSGSHLRAKIRCCKAGPGSGTYLAQGYLEPANGDKYEEEIAAAALLELAGLPPFYTNLGQPDAGKGPLPKLTF
jgi:flagellar basal body rod protein FlgG